MNRPPLSIKIISLYLILCGLCGIVIILLGGLRLAHNVVLGWQLSGALAVYYNMCILGFLPLWIGAGLWHLEEPARRRAIAYLLFFSINPMFSIFVPTVRAKAIEFMIGLNAQLTSAVAFQSVVLNWLAGLSTGILFIWFLIKRRGSFSTSKATTRVPEPAQPDTAVIRAFKRRCVAQLVICVLSLIAIAIIAVSGRLEWLIMDLALIGLFTVFNMRCPRCDVYYRYKRISNSPKINASYCYNCGIQLRGK